MKIKEYRFFYHYYKQKKKMTIHFKKSCMIVDNVVCNVKCETKWKKTQPNLVMQGFCKEVVIIDNIGYIQ